MPGKRSPDVIQVNLRLTKDLRKRLLAAAEKAGTSLNAEMVARLESTFRREAADKILERADHHLVEARRILDDDRRISDEALEVIAEIEKDLRAGLTVDEIFPINALLRTKYGTRTKALPARKRK